MRETECLLRGTGWIFKYKSGLSAPLKFSTPLQRSMKFTNGTTAVPALSSTPCHFQFLPRMTKYSLQHTHLETNKLLITTLQIRKQNLKFEV